MKIFELFGQQPLKPEVDFDLQDDLVFFINNDPEFYRRSYFPFINKFNQHCSAGRVAHPKAFAPIVVKAYKEYKNKFPVEGLEEELPVDQIENICEKLQNEQLEHYHKEQENKAEKNK